MTNQCGDEAVGTTAEAPNGNTYKIKIMIKPDGTEIRKFPNGYDVRVVRKQDILDCIDENIIDKEIALELITQCEIDACQYINEGKWTGLPYIGSVRLNDGGKILRENKELLNEGFEEWKCFQQSINGDEVDLNKYCFLSEEIFDFVTYDSGMDFSLGQQMIEVLKTILDKETFAYFLS